MTSKKSTNASGRESRSALQQFSPIDPTVKERQEQYQELAFLSQRLMLCSSKRLDPETGVWPSIADYRRIIHLLVALEPRAAFRKKHHPFWKQAVASADKHYPKIHLKDRIVRFVKYCAKQLPEPPPLSTKFFSALGNSSAPDDPPEWLLAFTAILKGEAAADGDHIDSMLELTTNRFQKLFKAANTKINLPSPWRPLVEAAAVLDAHHEHQAYVNNHRWLTDLADFVMKLENSDFDPVARELRLRIGHGRPEDYLSSLRSLDAGKARVARSRSRKKSAR